MQYGDKSAKLIKQYEKEHPIKKGITRTGLIAPFKDLQRNEKEMERVKIKESDKYFHCRGNFEASSRGDYGAFISATLSLGRELRQSITDKEYSLADSLIDMCANRTGRQGAKQHKTLEETCPPQHYKYK